MGFNENQECVGIYEKDGCQSGMVRDTIDYGYYDLSVNWLFNADYRMCLDCALHYRKQELVGKQDGDKLPSDYHDGSEEYEDVDDEGSDKLAQSSPR